MLPASLPNWNSGACTPTTTKPKGAYKELQAFTYGAVRIQLTHVYSQKSTSTTFPRNASPVSDGELTHRAALSGGKLFAALARQEAATAPRQTRKATLIIGAPIVEPGQRTARRGTECRRPSTRLWNAGLSQRKRRGARL